MTKKIAILRGINVGGKRKILMADLKRLFMDLGHTNIGTYIQSGNVVFSTNKKMPDIGIGDEIEKAILEKYGFDVPVIVRTAEEWEQSVKNNPFNKEGKTDINKLHLTFLKEKPTGEDHLKTEEYNFEPDHFAIKEKDVFLCLESKYHETKLSNNFFEKKLKTPATTRNWKTVLKLWELSR